MKIVSSIITENEKKNRDPHQVLDEFFEWYSLDNAAEELQQLLDSASVSNTIKPLKQGESLFFCEKLKSVLSAAWAISQKTQEVA